MTRNIVNKPHLTPNPDKPHPPGPPERAPCIPPGHGADPASGPADEEPTYDSCFDDLNLILSQSIQKPDPDPNLDSASVGFTRLSRDEVPSHLQPERVKTPRTSEIFRSVVAPAAGNPFSAHSAPKTQGPPHSEHEAGPAPDAMIPDVVLDRDRHIQDLASEEEDCLSEPRAPWSQVLLLSYSSAITLAMVWMLWTGRWSKSEPTPPVVSDRTISESSSRVVESVPVTPPPRIPAENQVALGQTIRIGDLEVTPLSVTAAPVELRRSIEPEERRAEEESLILRMKLTNISNQYAFIPLDQNMVRERGLRPHDPYIETSDGTAIRLFPLAIDSEWSIVGQEFYTLQPGESAKTFVAAEPGAARKLGDEMTWRVLLRVGVYRTDMIGVRFTENDVRDLHTIGAADDDTGSVARRVQPRSPGVGPPF